MELGRLDDRSSGRSPSWVPTLQEAGANDAVVPILWRRGRATIRTVDARHLPRLARRLTVMTRFNRTSVAHRHTQSGTRS